MVSPMIGTNASFVIKNINGATYLVNDSYLDMNNILGNYMFTNQYNTTTTNSIITADITTTGNSWKNYIRTGFTTASTNYYGDYWDALSSPGERLRKIIRERTTPQIIVKKLPDKVHDFRERRARQTLYRIIGEEAYQRYMRRGFVMAQGRSGLMYQIFPGHGITAVWQNGQMLTRLCVVLKGNFCPTDSLIMRYVLITSDEEKFKDLAIVHQPHKPSSNIIVPRKGSLPELFKSMGIRKVA